MRYVNTFFRRLEDIILLSVFFGLLLFSAYGGYILGKHAVLTLLSLI